MNSRVKLALIITEVLAVAALRAVIVIRRDQRTMPRASKVGRVRGRPVFTKAPFVGAFKQKSAQKRDNGSIKVGDIEIPLADPDVDRYDSGLAE